MKRNHKRNEVDKPGYKTKFNGLISNGRKSRQYDNLRVLWAIIKGK